MPKNNPPTIPKEAHALTLDDLNSFLPKGWADSLIKIAKDGGGEGASINALGITPAEFYALKSQNAIFKEVWARADAWRLDFWERALTGVVFGNITPHAVKPILWSLELLQKRFEAYQPAECEEKGAIPTLQSAELWQFQLEAKRRGLKLEIPKGARFEEAFEKIKYNAALLARVLDDIENKRLTPELEAAIVAYAQLFEEPASIEWDWKAKNTDRQDEWTFDPAWRRGDKGERGLVRIKETPEPAVDGDGLEL